MISESNGVSNHIEAPNRSPEELVGGPEGRTVGAGIGSAVDHASLQFCIKKSDLICLSKFQSQKFGKYVPVCLQYDQVSLQRDLIISQVGVQHDVC